MTLTDTAIRAAKPGAKNIKMSDEKGLYLLLTVTGGKWWRLDYRFGGKRKTSSLGVYPDTGWKDARARRDEARKMLAQGIDPGENRKAQKAGELKRAANSFEVVAREWFEVWKGDKSAGHSGKVLALLGRDIFPWLGGKPIAEITAPLVLDVLRRIEARGASETVRKAKNSISQVMRYAIQTGRAERDPCPDLKGAFKVATCKHFASITAPALVGELLRAMDAFKGTHVVRCALLLAPLVFVRPGELRTAKWADFDLDKAEWKFHVSKTRIDHLVPLSNQAVAVLREIHPLTGQHEHVFPGRDPRRPMSGATINAAIRRMGYDTGEDITGHGFRAMARTLLAEELHQDPQWIEHQLAHSVPDTLGTAYNRTKFLKERKAMMQLWADYLDKLKAGAEVIPLRGHAA
ncbi:MAG: integrase arm-type DNA-binding domain-containing protein [Zoogloeaceae bacterium]|jgi:integrase|nr:integrase arm-type DNA-binding domain-containing protein [Zoogloeaceae bacterium]